MNTLLSREERTNEAMRHQQECLAKYGETLGRDKAYNFHLWWHEVQYEKDGNKYNVRENPKPYSDFYSQHFIEQYFSSGSENNLIWNLTNEFIGDEIDAEYIETLLITAKNYGLFKLGAVVIFDNAGPGSVSRFESISEGYYYEQTRNVASSQVLSGSEANQDIAKAIKRWLKRRKKKLALVPTKAQVLPAQLEVTVTLENICKGDAKLKKIAVDLIDSIWKETKKAPASQENYPAICTAVYKLAEWLGMIENGIKGREWQAALSARYEVSISDGIGKYNLKNPKSGVFKRAVKLGFAHAATKNLGWTRNKSLPAIYQ